MKLILTTAYCFFLLVTVNTAKPYHAKALGTQQQPKQTSKYQLLKPTDFSIQLKQKPGIIIDVRTPGEYKKGHLQHAKLMDIFSDEFDAQLTKLERHKTYYVYCGIGGRSEECTDKMKKMGFTNIIELEGGFNNWLKNNLPVER